MADEKKKKRIRVTAEEVNKFSTRRKVFGILAAAIATLLAFVYVVSMLYKETGSFTISVNKHEMVQYGLSLSENRDLTHPSSSLNAKIDKAITNIAEESIPDNVGSIDGDHSGANHIAYTFYLFNAGDTDQLSYEWQIKMTNIYNGIDEALRVKLYINDVPTTYAKTSANGTGPEPGTVEFYSTDIVALGRIDNFRSGNVTKYTVLLWLEGTDPECIDNIIGGKMRLEMVFSTIH